MSKGIFVTGTGTDVGKTYVTALLVKKLRESGYKAGYYKAAISGASRIEESDAGYVKKISKIPQEEETLVSYLYQEAVSPHLAARWEGRPVEMEQVKKDFAKVKQQYEYVTVEGSGGILCPIRWDEKEKVMLEDVIQMLGLNLILVADAGLGSINATVLTTEYLKQKNRKVKGIILNHFTGTEMEEDNRKMIEELSGIPVIATVKPGQEDLETDGKTLASLYE
ncbi:dethiobiotin synthase [Blautia sp. An249]|uniref:dethiobiotin synthase n=1 Tax=Blautia sp. An249 TaxID=1965603 RepID=UPI000B370B4F|nr:dethiobiotin synthase [Blautia sp. An249]OUO77192.1 dethiobiotin synthase [Blautia sp. An249]